MRYGLEVPNCGEYADAHLLAVYPIQRQVRRGESI
jgi:hypothetical protein